jgi:hypothetical protein
VIRRATPLAVLDARPGAGVIEMPGLELLEVRRPPPELNGQKDQPKRLMPTHPRVRKHGRS